VTAETFVGVRDLDAVRGRTDLRRLRIVASELPDLDALEDLELTHLELVACRIGDPSGWHGCDRVDLVFTVVEGVPVELFCWPRGHVVGLPHPQGGRDFPLTAVPDADTMTEHERREAVLSWERDGLLPGAVAGGGRLLVRPGIGAVDAELLLARRFSDRERALRWWLADATGDLFDADTEASIGHFAQRFPDTLRLPVEVPGEPFRAAIPEPNWLLERHLSLWTLLRDCPPVRAASATFAIGVTAPDPLDLVAANGLLVVGRAVDGSGLLLVVVAVGDSQFRLYETTSAAFLDALADRRPPQDAGDLGDPDLDRLADLAGPRAAGTLAEAFASFGAFLDGVESLHPSPDPPLHPAPDLNPNLSPDPGDERSGDTGAEAQPLAHPSTTLSDISEISATLGLVAPAVQRQLRRLRALARPVRDDLAVRTPAGTRAVPPALRELMGYDWPAGWSARTPDLQWSVRWCHVEIEAGVLRETRAWVGIALVEEGQYFWVVDLDDDHAGDPWIHRVDHDDWDHVPSRRRLSGLLAELSLVED
jgi:hypothetical protein